MDPVGAISQLCSAFGLGSAAGLNAYIPLLAVGLLSRLGYADLSDSYAPLASTPVLLVLAVLGIVDFVGDKIPAVDHVLHGVGVVVSPVAGAIVFASQNSVLNDVHPAIALAAGFVVAGGLHATRAAVRPAATTFTAGLGNPVVSVVEDAVSFTLTVLAFAAPLVAFLLMLLMVVGVVKAWRRVRAWRAAGRKPIQET